MVQNASERCLAVREQAMLLVIAIISMVPRWWALRFHGRLSHAFACGLTLAQPHPSQLEVTFWLVDCERSKAAKRSQHQSRRPAYPALLYRLRVSPPELLPRSLS